MSREMLRIWKKSAGLITIGCLLFCNSSYPQNSNFHPWHVAATSGIQINFGPSSAEAMLVGATDTLLTARRYTYRPGYDMSVPAEMEVGYSGFRNLTLESSVRYNRIRTGIVEEFYNDEYDWMQLDMLSFRLSALLMMGSKSDQKPHCLLAGISIKGSMPVSVHYDTYTLEKFGIKNFSPSSQFNFTIDSKFHYYIFKNLWFLIAGVSIDLPTSLLDASGNIGEVDMKPGAAYEIKNNELKMYSFSGNIGIGYRPGKKKSGGTTR